MKDITTPVPPEEMKKVVQKCLEKAAGINYSQLIDYAQIKGDAIIVNDSRRLSSLIFHENLKGLSSQEQDTMCFNHQLRFMGNVVLTKCLDAVFGTSSGPSGASGETSGGHDATGRALHRGPAAERRTSLGGILIISVCRVCLFSNRVNNPPHAAFKDNVLIS